MVRCLPSPSLLTRILRRLGIQSAGIRKIDFLYSPGTQRPTKAVEILLNSMLQAGLSSAALAAVIPDARLLEIGCGRHIGFAPFCLGLGAKTYIGVDPTLDAELLMDPEAQSRYLAPAIHAAKNSAAGLSEFQNLPFVLDGTNPIDELMACCHLAQGGIGDSAETQGKVDICTSISCLEHIQDFAEAVRVVVSLSYSKTIHVHVVNLSNHLSKQEPFHPLYGCLSRVWQALAKQYQWPACFRHATGT